MADFIGYGFVNAAIDEVSAGKGKSWTQKAKDAGLSGAAKPNIATLQKVSDILTKLLPSTDSCILLAWLGGAHDQTDWQFWATTKKLSAQHYCGQDTAISWAGPRTVSAILNEMADVSDDYANLAALIAKSGNATAKQSAKVQNENADDDAIALAKDALDVLGTGAGIGIGAVVVLVVVIAAIKLLK